MLFRSTDKIRNKNTFPIRQLKQLSHLLVEFQDQWRESVLCIPLVKKRSVAIPNHSASFTGSIRDLVMQGGPVIQLRCGAPTKRAGNRSQRSQRGTISFDPKFAGREELMLKRELRIEKQRQCL